MTELLKITGLKKCFGEHEAVAGIDLQLGRGEVLGLLGPNGAGKTTTMKLLLGVLKPTDGIASVLGLDCTTRSLEVKRLVGYSPDEPAFYAFLTGRETLGWRAKCVGWTASRCGSSSIR